MRQMLIGLVIGACGAVYAQSSDTPLVRYLLQVQRLSDRNFLLSDLMYEQIPGVATAEDKYFDEDELLSFYLTQSVASISKADVQSICIWTRAGGYPEEKKLRASFVISITENARGRYWRDIEAAYDNVGPKSRLLGVRLDYRPLGYNVIAPQDNAGITSTYQPYFFQLETPPMDFRRVRRHLEYVTNTSISPCDDEDARYLNLYEQLLDQIKDPSASYPTGPDNLPDLSG